MGESSFLDEMGVLPGALVRGFRLRAGLTQDELAERSAISVRTVRDIEHGRVRHPHAASLDRLAASLGLSDVERQQLSRAFRPRSAPVGDSRLRVGILGPVVAYRFGAALQLGPPAQRTLLGLLALHRNEFVSHDEIIEVVWGYRPPRTCESQTQAMFGRLRQLIEPSRAPRSSSETLRRLRGGYLLETDNELIDAGRFPLLVARARAPHKGGDAIDIWNEAMSCWRGPVLADTHERLRQHPAAVALTRSRVDAVLAYADAAAAAGRHDLAIGKLQETVAGEHLHEGLHARLILAFAHAGDRAAALRQFNLIRRSLLEDLGIEPGERLRRAHRAIGGFSRWEHAPRRVRRISRRALLSDATVAEELWS